VPKWLGDRMTPFDAMITEAIVLEYGRDNCCAGWPIPSGSSRSAR
jgi:hypothetical protein